MDITKILNMYELKPLMIQLNGYDLYEVLLKLQRIGAANPVETDASNRSDDILHRLLPRLQYLEVLC